MFSTPQTLRRRTGKKDANRPTYIKQLVEEYESKETNEEKKEQILANLGNFAYDPINYEYFRRFNVVDVFLNNLRHPELVESNLNRILFSLGGLCNLCLEEKNKSYLIKNDVVNMAIFYVLNVKGNEELILVSITLVIFLFDAVDEECRARIIANKDLIGYLSELKQSNNKRVSNLVTVLFDDYLFRNELSDSQ